GWKSVRRGGGRPGGRIRSTKIINPRTRKKSNTLTRLTLPPPTATTMTATDAAISIGFPRKKPRPMLPSIPSLDPDLAVEQGMLSRARMSARNTVTVVGQNGGLTKLVLSSDLQSRQHSLKFLSP